MSKNPKNVKKAATKPEKVAGAVKVPRYEQRETISENAASKLPPKGKK